MVIFHSYVNVYQRVSGDISQNPGESWDDGFATFDPPQRPGDIKNGGMEFQHPKKRCDEFLWLLGNNTRFCCII